MEKSATTSAAVGGGGGWNSALAGRLLRAVSVTTGGHAASLCFSAPLNGDPFPVGRLDLFGSAHRPPLDGFVWPIPGVNVIDKSREKNIANEQLERRRPARVLLVVLRLAQLYSSRLRKYFRFVQNRTLAAPVSFVFTGKRANRRCS